MRKKIAPYLFPLGYACLGGLLSIAFLHLTRFLSPFGSHGHTLRFLGICLLLAVISVAAFVFLILINYNCLPEGIQTKSTIIVEVIESALLFLHALWLWSIPLDRLADALLL